MSGWDYKEHLVPCPHCGKDVLDHMTECPFCHGALKPAPRMDEARLKRIRRIDSAVFIIIAAVLILLILWKNNS